jgi:hypothetical protein
MLVVATNAIARAADRRVKANAPRRYVNKDLWMIFIGIEECRREWRVDKN